MSYTIFKNFSVKNGKLKFNAAESNVFAVKCGSDGREHECLVFRKGEIDFQTDNLIRILYDGTTCNNDYYGLSDIQIYSKLMLASAFGGDKFYQAKHKAVLQAIFDFTNGIQQADREAFVHRHNITADYLSQNMYSKEFRDKYGDYDDYRVYRNLTDSEFEKLVEIVEQRLADFKAATKTEKVIIELTNNPPDSPAYIREFRIKTGRMIIGSKPVVISIPRVSLLMFAKSSRYKITKANGEEWFAP